MFNLNKESNLFWFNGDSFCSNIQFELIGIICGLAIFNNALLDIHLPLVCFKKLLDERPNLDDMKEYSFEIGNSLEYILNYTDDNLEDVLMVNFMIETDFFGESKKFNMIENGENIYVN